MDGIRTYALTLGAVLTLGALGGPVMALSSATLPASPTERVRFFAICAGRYSALIEHQRLFRGRSAQEADAMRAQFDGLLDAVLPYARDHGLPGEMVLSWRLAAKAAQAQLLQRADFQLDADIAAQSQRTAQRLFRECSGRLLGT